MAWTAATRGDYVRPSGSYASDVTDREWALILPLLPAVRPGGRPRTTCLRQGVNAVFYLLQAGCQWRIAAAVQRVDQDATGATIRKRERRRCRTVGRA